VYKTIPNMVKEAQIESALKALFENLKFTQSPEGLYDPLRYMIELGGKRVRPRLCLTTYSLFKDSLDEYILQPAAALEVFHSFTLIHDDIMDKADIRRGKPTVHVKWDDNTAILSGDVMSIESYRLLAKAKGEYLPAALKLFTKTAAEVCEGQQYDMEFESRNDVSMDKYIKMIGLKTAVLIACAAKMGAILAGADENLCSLCYDFGYDLGLAFQIADDYLDIFGNPKVFGKAIGGDILNDKKTWLLIKALEKSGPEHKERLGAAMALPMGTEEEKKAKIKAVKAIYEDLKVGEDAMAEVSRYHEMAMFHAQKLNLDEEGLEMLANYADKLVKREK